MKVKLRTTMAGPKGSFDAGSVIDLEQARAYDLIERGYAVQIEDATLGPRETAEAPANRRKSKP